MLVEKDAVIDETPFRNIDMIQKNLTIEFNDKSIKKFGHLRYTSITDVL